MNEIIRLEAIPSLEEFVPASADLSGEYWTPDVNEVRRLVFWCIEDRQAPKHDDPDKYVTLPCCVFIEPVSDGQYKTVTNGSKRLVAAFQNTEIAQGTPVQVSYLGKKQNRTNSFKSDHWSVFVLKRKDS